MRLPVENFGKKKSLAIFKCAEFEQSGLQKYEQPTKVFCLTENLEEFFSEIKSSSNLKKFYLFERRDVISQICFTSTRLHKGNQRNLVAFFTPGQAIGEDRSGNWRSQSEAGLTGKLPLIENIRYDKILLCVLIDRCCNGIASAMPAL